jgi:TRAP-type C4-dicarboxylate transport system permease small subunit
VASVFLAIMMIVLSVQVFCRYVLNNAISFAEELIRYLEVWVVFLGASMCVKDDTHPTVTVFMDLFPKNVRDWVRIIVNIAVFAVGIVMIIVGYRFAARYVDQLTPTLRISIAFVYAAIPVSGFLICIQSANNFLEGLRRYGKTDTTGDESL